MPDYPNWAFTTNEDVIPKRRAGQPQRCPSAATRDFDGHKDEGLLFAGLNGQIFPRRD
ncbi:hypothetical protein C8J56DRAFT_1059745 [Mycena floridula]|nr:hypothetical protein C8J56DRAFT_1059745 [Mycena floridula]